MVRIAKIVKSNSHVDYIARVIDKLESADAPSEDDYGFGQFVSIPVTEDQEVVGIIYDTQLVNPEYGNYGPRLSTPTELSVLSPDHLDERGILLGIVLLGWHEKCEAGPADDTGWTNRYEVLRRVIPVGQEVHRLGDQAVQDFHRSADGAIQLHYYSQIIAHAGTFAVPLLETVIRQLEPACEPAERKRLGVLKKTRSWQRTLGGMRL